MTNLRRNIGFQSVYQVLNTCLPLITAPFLARVLGASQQGIFSFTQSIVDFFILFAMLGITNHGTRYIAEQCDDRMERGKAFLRIYLIQFLTSVIMIGLYIFYVILLCDKNHLISCIQVIALLASLLNINWFYFGIEKFEVTVTWNTIVRIATVILIFLFVDSPNDLWIYTLLMTLSTLVGHVILWIYLPRYVEFSKIEWKEVVEQIRPIVVLFIPLLAMSFYHVMDKTMLGIFSNYTETGYYYNVDKIINIPLGIITGLSTVLFPRMVVVLKEKGEKYSIAFFRKCVEGIILISSAMMFGIIAIAEDFSLWFLGREFEECGKLIIVLSPVMIIKSISSTIRYQFLIPNGKEKIFTISVVIGAVVNVIANLVLIPKLGALGAIIGTLLAEVVDCLIQIAFIQKKTNVCRTFIKSIPYLLIGCMMWRVVESLKFFFTGKGLEKIILEMCLGSAVFVGGCFGYWLLVKEKCVLDEFMRLIKKKSE